MSVLDNYEDLRQSTNERMTKKYLTVQGAAKTLGVSERTIYRYILKYRHLKATKIDRWRITPAALNEFVKSRSSQEIVKKKKNAKRW